MTPSPTSLLFTRTLQDAEDSAVLDWRWEYGSPLLFEFIRPDTREPVRYVPDTPSSLNGLRWGTKVYLGRNWTARRDADRITHLIETSFFVEGDPKLPPPREPRKKRLERTTSELRDLLQQASRD